MKTNHPGEITFFQQLPIVEIPFIDGALILELPRLLFHITTIHLSEPTK